MDAPEVVPFVALLLAAGQSSRLGEESPKPYLPLRGRTVLEWSALRLARLPGHLGTVLAVDAVSLATRIPGLAAALASHRVLHTIAGGETRQESCALAYEAAGDAAKGFTCVLVHDCARPFFSLAGTRQALQAAAATGGAILGHWARDTLKRVDPDGRIVETLPREDVFQAATPQVFRNDAFTRMLAHARDHGTVGTDEAGLAEAAGVPVVAIPCPADNVKLTYPEDLRLLPCLEKLLEDDDH